MDGLKQIKDFLQDLIRPIVVEAVQNAIPTPEAAKMKKYLTVKEVGEIYHLSVSAIYDRFKSGALTRVKNGGKTYVLSEEMEKSLMAKKYAGRSQRRQYYCN